MPSWPLRHSRPKLNAKLWLVVLPWARTSRYYSMFAPLSANLSMETRAAHLIPVVMKNERHKASHNEMTISSVL